jgi:xanthine dehydrogenase accessory factor
VDELVHEWPDVAFGRLALDAGSAIVVLSHDEKFDQPALLAALRSQAGYVGAIGSSRTNEKRFAWLRAQGFSDDDLARIHAPIGLDIGARTAEETALAIVAEMLASRRGRAGGSLSARNLVTTS